MRQSSALVHPLPRAVIGASHQGGRAEGGRAPGPSPLSWQEWARGERRRGSSGAPSPPARCAERGAPALLHEARDGAPQRDWLKRNLGPSSNTGLRRLKKHSRMAFPPTCSHGGSHPTPNGGHEQVDLRGSGTPPRQQSREMSIAELYGNDFHLRPASRTDERVNLANPRYIGVRRAARSPLPWSRLTLVPALVDIQFLSSAV